jgi:hypothetical protein
MHSQRQGVPCHLPELALRIEGQSQFKNGRLLKGLRSCMLLLSSCSPIPLDVAVAFAA